MSGLLTDRQLSIVSKALEGGIFVRRKMFIWSGSKQWIEDAVGGGRRQVRKYKLPEFRQSTKISKAIAQCFEDYTYDSYFGIFVPDASIVPFFARIEEIRRDIDAFIFLLQNERPRIKKYLKEHCYDYVCRVWRYCYGKEGEPSVAFADEVASNHAESFPEGNELLNKFRLAVLPSNPMCEPGSKYERAFGEDANIHVVTAVHNSIVSKRFKMFKTFVKLLETGEKAIEDGMKTRLNNTMDATMFKARSVMRQDFYGDEVLTQAASDLLDKLILIDSRNPHAICAAIARLAKVYYEDEIYQIRHLVK
jgi:hypothetical protein